MSVITKPYFVLSEGEKITIPFNIVNNSGVKANNVTLVFDAFPAGISVDSTIKDVGTYTTLSRTWSIPSLEAGQTETLWVVFNTTDLSETREITGTITRAENSDYPGEYETTVAVSIQLMPVGTTFYGYTTKEQFSIYTTANGTISLPETDSGISYIITATGNVTFDLPPATNVEEGHTVVIKIIDDGGNDVTITTAGATTIEGANSEILFTGDYRKYVLKKSNGNLWIKFNN